MDEECIHGLQRELCGVCSPRPEPATVRRPAAFRPAGASRASAPRGSGGASGASRAAESASARRLTTLRALHLTPIENLPAILTDGALVPGATPTVDLSSELTRQLRASAELPDGTVADAVPFYLGPGARRWVELLEGAAGPGWSDAARRIRSADLVVLSWAIAGLADRAVLADGDAAATVTRTVPLLDQAAAQSAFARLERDERVEEAELLVLGPVELDALAIVGVANEPARQRVAALIAEAGYSPRFAVHPPWFQVG